MWGTLEYSTISAICLVIFRILEHDMPCLSDVLQALALQLAFSQTVAALCLIVLRNPKLGVQIMAVFKMHQLAMLPSFFLSLLLFISFAPVSSGSVGYEYDLGVTPVNALFPRQTTASSSTGTESYTCGPGSPCSNGACCGSSGWCGYGPTYCGDGCQSDCDATAECGEYAATAGTTCPLNVCCSQYGFCG